MSDLTHCDDDPYAFDDGDTDCTICGGDGYVECDDPIQCMAPNHFGGGLSDLYCACRACGGTGRGKDQVVW